MKKIILGIFLALLIGVPGFAQKQKTSPDAEQEIKPAKQTGSKNDQTRGDALLQAGTGIEAQLQQSLDVKNTSVGDRLVLTTTKAIKQNGRVVVQKGARLIGRVTEVQQRTKQNAQSKIGVVFERLEGKNLSAPVSATIVAITQANAAASLGDSLDTGLAGSANGSGGVSRSGSGGGGLLGGVTNTVGGVVNTTTNAVGGVTNSAGQTLGGTTGTLGNTLNGIRLSQTADAAAGGATTLSTQNKNLRLEKGVTFQLKLTSAIEN